MSDGIHASDADEQPTSTRNTHHGTARHVIQANVVRGDINLGANPPRAWLLPAAIVIAAVLVGAAIVAVPGDGQRTSADAAVQAPSELLVTADLSANDMGPWGYVSESPDFPGAELIRRMARPMAGVDPAIARDVRLSPGAVSVQHQLIRLHLEGPKGREVRVTDIRPVIRATRPPLSGSLVSSPPQGAEPSSEVLLKLDDPFPVVQSSVEDEEKRHRVPTGPFFPAHTIKLNDGETHEVVLTVSTERHSYEYDLAVSYQSGAEIKEVRVNDGGQSFRISGFACSGPNTASYASVHQSTGDFSMPSVPDPGHFSSIPDC
ncbi:hypothetical protein [Lentzea sp. NPDC003310]|uniref:hypothetical protein n=1 Tax=Lentzea sp. NPDC003310 TaxID=3154447 RepID=UPI0033BF0026